MTRSEERKALGGVILNNEPIPDCEFHYQPHDFIRKAMLDLRTRGVPIDEVTIGSELKGMDLYHKAGRAKYLARLTEGL